MFGNTDKLREIAESDIAADICVYVGLGGADLLSLESQSLTQRWSKPDSNPPSP